MFLGMAFGLSLTETMIFSIRMHGNIEAKQGVGQTIEIFQSAKY